MTTPLSFNLLDTHAGGDVSRIVALPTVRTACGRALLRRAWQQLSRQDRHRARRPVGWTWRALRAEGGV